MELVEVIDYLSKAPRAGRADFGKTVLIPEAICNQIVITLIKIDRNLKSKAKADIKVEAKTETKIVPKVIGAEPE